MARSHVALALALLLAVFAAHPGSAQIAASSDQPQAYESHLGAGENKAHNASVYQLRGKVKAPRVIYSPDPEYSKAARKAKLQGTVGLFLVVTPEGRPRDIKVVRSLGMGLDEKAVVAVSRWKFKPATIEGKPVAVEINVLVDFRL